MLIWLLELPWELLGSERGELGDRSDISTSLKQKEERQWEVITVKYIDEDPLNNLTQAIATGPKN